ncbi:Hypothetical predicted protein [Mytilus galloprovincialis]|uniref:Uncharacterized protein n=1 Tax=Mytilus galloprovincialis TaxID=29158 RepID=A0A8B6FVA4_MYTGA|nr:Hypothetical predicted protein [Mytilus galloprovincialis]
MCSCKCEIGWTGSCCSESVDDCQGISCNNGTCQDGLNSYNCSCDAGYKGDTCDTDINECASNPCKHSGVCHDEIDKFLCACPPGFTGAQCEADINECASSPCQNQGRCRDSLLEYKCICATGYTGTNCEIKPFDLIKPNIILPETKFVHEGLSSLTIPCYAEGIPVPTITWESLDKPSLQNNTKQLAHFLIFKNVSTIDGGHYMCTAKNKVGTDIKVVQIIVQGM